MGWLPEYVARVIININTMRKTIQLLLIIVLLFQIACSDNSASEHARNYANSEKDTCIKKVSIHFKKAKLNNKIIREKPDTTIVFANETYILFSEKSELEWFCGKHTGVVMIKSGRFQIENKHIIAAEFYVNMDSIYDVDIDNNLMRGTLENILRSEDFFDVKNFPLAIFKMDSIVNIKGNLFQVFGNLKIKEITKSIQFTSVFDISADTLYTVSEKFTINRTHWGINHMSKSHVKNEDEFVFTDSLHFTVHLTAIAE